MYPNPYATIGTYKTSRRPHTENYSRTITTRGAFDVADAGEAELLVESFAVEGGAVRAFTSTKPTWSYAAEVLADNPVMYYRLSEAPSSAPGAAQYQSRYVSSNSGSGGGTLGTAYLLTGGWGTSTGPTADVGLSLQARDDLGTGTIRGLTPYADSFLDSISLNPFAASPAATVGFWAANKPVTVECWFYRTSGGRAAGEMIWASSHNADGRPYCFISRATTGAVGTINFQPDGNQAGTGCVWNNIPYATLPDSAWNHIALTWSGATRIGTLYINGVQYSTTSTASVDIPGAPLYGMMFGNWFQSASVWPITDGSRIDEIACYSGVLSAARIADHYNAR